MTRGMFLSKINVDPVCIFSLSQESIFWGPLWMFFGPHSHLVIFWCCIRRASATLAVLWSGATVPGLCHHLLGPARSSDQVEGDLCVDDCHNGWFTKVIKPTISRVDKVNWDKTNLEPQPQPSLFCHPLPVNVLLASYKSKVISIFAPAM